MPHVGGVESHVRHIANYLAAVGDEVEVITFDAAPWIPDDGRDGPVRVRRFRSGRVSDGVGSPGRLARYLRAHSDDYDVVHVHNYQSLLPLGALIARPPRLVITPHYHETSPSRLRKALRRVYRPVGRLALGRADRVICVSHSERRILATHLGLAPDLVTVIPNGVDTRLLRRAEPFPVTVPVVLALGRLERYKRVDRALEAMAKVTQPAQLVVIGDGPARLYLERQAADLGLSGDAVRFLGRLDDHEVQRWLATARVVVSLSEIEAFGLTVLEGLITRSRVVASDIPAYREVADSLPGAAIRLLPATADARELAEQFDTALADPRPPPLVSAVDWSEVARQTREVYLEVLSTPRRRTGTRATGSRLVQRRQEPRERTGKDRS
jgi:glycosyltransferase involved in cell wall biosynthesis